MTDINTDKEGQAYVDKAVAEGGAYEVLHRRLIDQGQQLRTIITELNERRLHEFGSSQMSAVGRVRIRTENNCIARDIVRVGDCLLFGYNVFIGLRKEISVADVFSLYKLIEAEDGYEAEPVSLENGFISDSRFVQDFDELYTYYRNARLLQLIVKDEKLLASFQMGERYTDIRVFRWSISTDGTQINYIDNRGERDIALPEPFDFEWQRVTREMTVNGRYPHINILDTVFIETTGGDLTLKIENNTEIGLGIYSEKVEDETQSLDDAQIEFAQLGSLILLKILPYKEEQWRYLVYNSINQKVERIDLIGQSCIQLPEDHGIIFPGGYYLQNGECKRFEQSMSGMRFKRSVRSPNGEDVLYIFYDPELGRSVLLTYNMINRDLQNPIFGHGYARLEDGRMVIFSAEGDEPTRIHPMQIWKTPFFTEEFAAKQPERGGFFGRIGNAELVRGISDLYSLCRDIETPEVSMQRYTLLSRNVWRLFDAYYWLGDGQLENLPILLKDVAATAERVLDEYEKVESIRAQTDRAMQDAEAKQKKLLNHLLPDNWDNIKNYVDALNQISDQRGLLLTILEYRYIDKPRIGAMEAELLDAQTQIGNATVRFLAKKEALAPFSDALIDIDSRVQHAETVSQLKDPLNDMRGMTNDLDMLSGLLASLPIEDAMIRTQIVESISEIYARLNQAKAHAEHYRKKLGSSENIAQFGAQFKLFGQSVTSALAAAHDPERCDEQLSRLLIQLEELESQFGDNEQFIADILTKREEVLETFETHKQSLLDDRQRKAQTLQDAAQRIFDTLPRRTKRFEKPEELNAFFASDPLIIKLKDLADRLRALQDNVKADDVEAKLKSARDQALRSLRDKTDLFDNDGNIIKLGTRHRFSVNTQELDLTLLPKEDRLCLHLTGTDYIEDLNDPELNDLRDYWHASLESESPLLYRSEYLAALVINASETNEYGLNADILKNNISKIDSLIPVVRGIATPRYKEGYEKGIHDHDAAKILMQLVPLKESIGLLHYSPMSRALASLFWDRQRHNADAELWPERARAVRHIKRIFERTEAQSQLESEIAYAMQILLDSLHIDINMRIIKEASEYLVRELEKEHIEFVFSGYSKRIIEGFKVRMQGEWLWDAFQETLSRLIGRPAVQWKILESGLLGLCREPGYEALEEYVPEAIGHALLSEDFPMKVAEVDLRFTVEGLFGDHARIHDGQLTIAVDDFYARVRDHKERYLLKLRRYQEIRQKVIISSRKQLHIEEFKPKPLTSFVRNKLINDVYLPIIGDNLAKQMGTVGDDKRSDLMGLLMLISPPGYGKTTLMEYIAHRLGLVFMKVNGPALGHGVRSLDPAQAPDATSAQELEKLNLGLEMGNNVMLYVDDIQHTHPEFLQKFISLCDATRRIEGIWKGRTKTYDMRGRRFCVVMAGNPYTESGEAFKIPDMLANRADIYNLGDTLSGMEDIFALSYIENALTSNPILAPLATRDMADVYRFVSKAEGRDFSGNELSYDYSSAEINEISDVLVRLLHIRDIVLKVNQHYIASAAQDDQYRVEPPFKLQGSYRNMNKMAEKVSAIMNDKELFQLIADHYQGEAQLLTTGAEENLLKLAELRGNMTADQSKRWTQIKKDFLRVKAMGGRDTDGVTRVIAQLNDLVQVVRDLKSEEERYERLLSGVAQIANGIQQLKMTYDEMNQISNHINGLTDGVRNMDSTLGEVSKFFQNKFPVICGVGMWGDIPSNGQDK